MNIIYKYDKYNKYKYDKCRITNITFKEKQDNYL